MVLHTQGSREHVLLVMILTCPNFLSHFLPFNVVQCSYMYIWTVLVVIPHVLFALPSSFACSCVGTKIIASTYWVHQIAT